jgi:hypothetical protein
MRGDRFGSIRSFASWIRKLEMRTETVWDIGGS